MLWTLGGNLIVDAQGRAISCDECPCDEEPSSSGSEPFENKRIWVSRYDGVNANPAQNVGPFSWGWAPDDAVGGTAQAVQYDANAGRYIYLVGSAFGGGTSVLYSNDAANGAFEWETSGDFTSDFTISPQRIAVNPNASEYYTVPAGLSAAVYDLNGNVAFSVPVEDLSGGNLLHSHAIWLPDGNIVQGYSTNLNGHFKVVDTSGALVWEDPGFLRNRLMGLAHDPTNNYILACTNKEDPFGFVFVFDNTDGTLLGKWDSGTYGARGDGGQIKAAADGSGFYVAFGGSIQYVTYDILYPPAGAINPPYTDPVWVAGGMNRDFDIDPATGLLVGVGGTAGASRYGAVVSAVDVSTGDLLWMVRSVGDAALPDNGRWLATSIAIEPSGSFLIGHRLAFEQPFAYPWEDYNPNP